MESGNASPTLSATQKRSREEPKLFGKKGAVDIEGYWKGIDGHFDGESLPNST